MKITEKDVRYVAGLANLHLADHEVGKLQADLNGILAWIDTSYEAVYVYVPQLSNVNSYAPDDTRPQGLVILGTTVFWTFQAPGEDAGGVYQDTVTLPKGP